MLKWWPGCVAQASYGALARVNKKSAVKELSSAGVTAEMRSRLWEPHMSAEHAFRPSRTVSSDVSGFGHSRLDARPDLNIRADLRAARSIATDVLARRVVGVVSPAAMPSPFGTT